MNPEPNFFFVNRELLHSDRRWLSEKFTRGQAWVDLFGLAQHHTSFIRIRGIGVTVERGQLAYSQLTLAKRWKWSRGKVRRFLKELENDGDIVQQNTEVTTLITVQNYDKWQGDGTTNGTTNGQQTDNKRYTYNKNNNVNNEKKERERTHPPDKKSLTEEDIQEISEFLSVSQDDVRRCKDSMLDWMASSGKVKKDYKATLRNWIRREVQEGKIKEVDQSSSIKFDRFGNVIEG